jgi:hypothetical protein
VIVWLSARKNDLGTIRNPPDELPGRVLRFPAFGRICKLVPTLGQDEPMRLRIVSRRSVRCEQASRSFSAVIFGTHHSTRHHASLWLISESFCANTLPHWVVPAKSSSSTGPARLFHPAIGGAGVLPPPERRRRWPNQTKSPAIGGASQGRSNRR